MTGEQFLQAFDEWIDDWRTARSRSGLDGYSRDRVLEAMMDLQERFHRIADDEKIEQRLQKLRDEENE